MLILFFLLTVFSTVSFANGEADFEIANDTVISFIGVGDIMMGSNYPKSYLPPNKDILFDTLVTKVLNSADITFGNLEGPILDSGGTPKYCRDMSKCFAFRTPEKYAPLLKKNGFNLLALANNHVMDMGVKGAKNTVRVLDELEIAYAGNLMHPDTVIEYNGLRIGLTAFSPNRGCLHLNDYPTAKRVISSLKERSDIVIVSFHGGAEGRTHRHITRENEIYFNEDRGNVYEFARLAIDNGADIVFGHGPHVTRAFDIYKDRFIAYSLGNFLTYGRFNLEGEAGIGPIAKVYTNREGKFLAGEVISTYQNYHHGPRIDSRHRALKSVIELTASDIPEVDLVFEDDGFFYRKGKKPVFVDPPAVIPISQIEILTLDTLVLEKSDTNNIAFQVFPDENTDSLIFVSTDTSVVTTISDDMIVAVGSGYAKITISSSLDSSVSGSVFVSVIKPEVEIYEPKISDEKVEKIVYAIDTNDKQAEKDISRFSKSQKKIIRYTSLLTFTGTSIAGHYATDDLYKGALWATAGLSAVAFGITFVF